MTHALGSQQTQSLVFPTSVTHLTFNIRAEFTNVLNRTEMGNPTSTNALATQTRQVASDPTSKPTAGFGFINSSAVASPPRAGTIIGRFQF